MANVRDLVVDISERRQRLDQTFYTHLRKLRREHGDRAVDQALAAWQPQRGCRRRYEDGLAPGAPRPVYRQLSGTVGLVMDRNAVRSWDIRAAKEPGSAMIDP